MNKMAKKHPIEMISKEQYNEIMRTMDPSLMPKAPELEYTVCNIDFEITYFCNMQCPYCAVKPRLTKQINQYNTEQAVQILEEFIQKSIRAKVPVFRTYLAGGEPTIHPQFNEIYTAFYETLTLHQHHFKEVFFGIPTNFARTPEIMLQVPKSNIKARCTIAIHPETKIPSLIKKVQDFQKKNQGQIEIYILFLYGSTDEQYNQKQVQYYKLLTQIFKDTDVQVHMNPMVYYWKDNICPPRPQIKELKYCKPLNFVIDQNLNLLDACEKCTEKNYVKDREFPKEPKICSHVCYEDYCRGVFDKAYVYSEDIDFMYLDRVPEEFRGDPV